jgi:hypothetical protein
LRHIQGAAGELDETEHDVDLGGFYSGLDLGELGGGDGECAGVELLHELPLLGMSGIVMSFFFASSSESGREGTVRIYIYLLREVISPNVTWVPRDPALGEGEEVSAVF